MTDYSRNKQNRNVTCHPGRRISRNLTNVIRNNLGLGYEAICSQLRPQEHPIITENPLGVAFGYVSIPYSCSRRAA
jgi:hypothetical protein